MIIFSFGSDFNIETVDEAEIQRVADQVAYAQSKGIEVGGYDLICLDRGHEGYGGNVGDEWVVIGEDGSLTVDACFASGWYDKLHDLIANFVTKTGLSMLETDGPYGGASCSSTTHDHHHDLADSVYRQTQQQNTFYHEMREINVFINQPDNFFFHGGSKSGLGYDENTFSLPASRDIDIARTLVYDNTYTMLPTQGWMFLPLSEYHSGGDSATFLDKRDMYEVS
jgi:hypothetical protein